MVDIPDLSGKVILVTGGNAGIGAGFVKALAAHNPTCIYLCARKTSSAEALIETIHKHHPVANIVPLTLDLSDFDSVKKCAEVFISQSDRLDLLFLNAGISGTAAEKTKSGYETQFGVNHMGHALLTQYLMPTLLQTQNLPDSDVRIILTSSLAAHRFAPGNGLALQEMKTTGETLSTIARYGHSKLANLLFGRKLAQLYPEITTTSHHPGTVKSEIWGKATGMRIFAMLITPWVWWSGLDCDQGAETGIWCAVTPVSRLENGRYYEPVGKLVDGSKNAQSQQQTDELWEWTTQELAAAGGPGWPKK